MSRKKKKLNNRLDKLFDELNIEQGAQQVEVQERSRGKSSKKIAPVIDDSPVREVPDSIAEIDPIHPDKSNHQEAHLVPSTMLSTAFRTDESSWATLKVIDELSDRTWGTEEQLLVRQVGDQLSLALENARLFQDAQRRAKEMTALAEVAQDISATLELQKVLERIAIQAKDILNAITSAIYVPDTSFETLIPIAAFGDEADKIKSDSLAIGKGIIGNIALTKSGRIVNNTGNDPKAMTIPGTETVDNENIMVAPILIQDTLSGLLAIWRIGVDQQFSETELEFLESLAQQASIAVKNARLYEETESRAKELAILNEMARAFTQTLEGSVILENAYQYTSKLMDTTNFYIALYNAKEDLFTVPFAMDSNTLETYDEQISMDSTGPTEWIIRNKRPLLIKDNVEAVFDEMGLVRGEKPPKSWMGVPMLRGDESIGVIGVQSFDTSNLFNEHDQDLLMTIASQVAIALENARLFQEAKSRARREKILRVITARIRTTNDPEMIAKTAVRELGQALGASAFIHLGSDNSNKAKAKPAKSKRKAKKKSASSKSKSKKKSSAKSTKKQKKTAQRGK